MTFEHANSDSKNTDQPIPKITYFDVRGRAEVIRILLEEAGTQYTERRISIDEWPELKSNFTFGQLPIYEEGDLLLNQSNAIYRYLGRKYCLYGDSMMEQARCDIIQETFVDAQNTLGAFYWNPDFENLRDELEKNELPELLTKIDNLFQSNSAESGYWVGTRLSFVDIVAWHFLDYVRPFSLKTLNKFEKLSQFKALVEQRPRISDYLKSDRPPAIMTVSLSPFGGTPETS